MKRFAIAAALLLAAGSAIAAEAREARPVACLNYSIAKLPDGASVGMCQSAKGKPRLLRSFALASVTNPETGVAAKLLVGFP